MHFVVPKELEALMNSMSDGKTSVAPLIEALDVAQLRSGRQALRDRTGWLDDAIEVEHARHAQMAPTLPTSALMGLVQVAESEFRGKKHVAICRAAMVLFQTEGDHPALGLGADIEADQCASARQSSRNCANESAPVQGRGPRLLGLDQRFAFLSIDLRGGVRPGDGATRGPTATGSLSTIQSRLVAVLHWQRWFGRLRSTFSRLAINGGCL